MDELEISLKAVNKNSYEYFTDQSRVLKFFYVDPTNENPSCLIPATLAHVPFLDNEGER